MEEIALIDFAKKVASKDNEHTEAGILARAFVNAYEAIQEITRHNRISNDLEAYLFYVASWGKGEFMVRPRPSDFGVE